MSTSYRVKEIFGPTIQGEGSHAGEPVVFLRLAGCNKWNGHEAGRALGTAGCARICDTDFAGGHRMTAEAIEVELASKVPDGMKLRVVISGGEPTMQSLDEVVRNLHRHGWEIHLETNGSASLGILTGLFHHVTCSPKQPLAETHLRGCDDLKILWPPIDPEITPEAFATFSHKTLWLQPVMPKEIRGSVIGYKTNLEMTIGKCIEIDARLSLQTHKMIGVP